MEQQRFASLTDEEIQHILDEKDSANSLKGSHTSFGTLMKYYKEKHIDFDGKTVSKEELNNILRRSKKGRWGFIQEIFIVHITVRHPTAIKTNT